jgi:hypothetical protein
MASYLSTERLRLRPWAESDVDEFRGLVTERGNGVPSVANIRARIATQLLRQHRPGSRCFPSAAALRATSSDTAD